MEDAASNTPSSSSVSRQDKIMSDGSNLQSFMLHLEHTDDIVLDMARDAPQFLNSHGIPAPVDKTDVTLLQVRRRGYREVGFDEVKVNDYLAKLPDYAVQWTRVNRAIIRYMYNPGINIRDERKMWSSIVEGCADKTWKLAVLVNQSMNADSVKGLEKRLEFLDDLLDQAQTVLHGSDEPRRLCLAPEYIDTM